MYTAANAKRDFNQQAIDAEIKLAEDTIEYHTKGGETSVAVWSIKTGQERMITEMEARGFKAEKSGEKSVLIRW